MRHHFVREAVEEGKIEFAQACSQEQVVNTLTKSHSAEEHSKHLKALLNLAESYCVFRSVWLMVAGVVKLDNPIGCHLGRCSMLSLAETIPDVGLVVTDRRIGRSMRCNLLRCDTPEIDKGSSDSSPGLEERIEADRPHSTICHRSHETLPLETVCR